jgi:hypothetical protein
VIVPEVKILVGVLCEVEKVVADGAFSKKVKVIV